MSAFYLNEIPGYRDAVNRARAMEFRAREDNWLTICGSVAGSTIRVMTVRDYVGLLRIGSPFLARQEPTFEELGTFLWVLSPEIERWHNRAGWRKQWLVGCRWGLFNIYNWQRFLHARKLRRHLKIDQLEKTAERHYQETGNRYEIPEAHPLTKALVEAFAYIDRIFLDRPAGVAKEGNASGLLYLTSWFDSIQSEYTKSDDDVWKMGLPHLFSRLKAIYQRLSPGEPDFNARQDEVRNRILHAANHDKMSAEDILGGKLNLN